MAIYKADNEFDLIYNFYQAVRENPTVGYPYVCDFKGNPTKFDNRGNHINQIFTHFLIDFYQKNGFPKVMDQQTYDYYRDNENPDLKLIKVYRGEQKIEYARNLIDSPTYHYGTGHYGEGIYTTDDILRAGVFSGKKNTHDLVFEYLINPNAKIVDYNEINMAMDYVLNKVYNETTNINESNILGGDQEKLEKINELLKFLQSKNDPAFFESVVNNYTFLAVYLGYDVVERTMKDRSKDYMILNRGMMCVSENIKNRIMSVSESNK